MSDTEDVIRLLALTAAQSQFWATGTLEERSSQQYRRTRNQIRCAPPGWLFGPVWFILDCLCIASAFLWLDQPTPSQYFTATAIVYLCNVVLKARWSVSFWQRQYGVSLLILLGIIGTGIAYLVLVGLADLWVVFGLYVPYVLWCTFAATLNLQYYMLPRPQQMAHSGRRAVERRDAWPTH